MNLNIVRSIIPYHYLGLVGKDFVLSSFILAQNIYVNAETYYENLKMSDLQECTRTHINTHIHTNTQTHITDLLCVSCIRNKLNHPHRLLTKFALLQLLLQVLQASSVFLF